LTQGVYVHMIIDRFEENYVEELVDVGPCKNLITPFAVKLTNFEVNTANIYAKFCRSTFRLTKYLKFKFKWRLFKPCKSLIFLVK